ncbi:hypothetical protein MJO28_001570 [Puccinia striiformis f. sp. tritici]|uniref:Uncharacterized protein n=3 Tax=Puccinia striiformis TaxID=27350 RepID=A0A0L0W522_9BASI|nr:uncharacterized protein Pst134EA_031490 [Puccinia striiformis f. sp. tritici]KAI9624450.1 hypothetical protein H4Q26_016851 [Puccinia striiformis f. sp. tritici PST-130]KNF06614.1 hypothetical protein PSTG_00488 [Puccinia striiformis f. sp. tritici PST-78]POW05157.1 hypothetical protein PSTT_09900 [Puccinia striiformis]KAH9445266.1 hypothetical protein Pst134EA_031490 [Puccinia striiformis f. sp. tritici]KAH9464728.1 hypothetical protein Pst134EB_004243 [Puccinia striiformis f. sp. tritici]
MRITSAIVLSLCSASALAIPDIPVDYILDIPVDYFPADFQGFIKPENYVGISQGRMWQPEHFFYVDNSEQMRLPCLNSYVIQRYSDLHHHKLITARGVASLIYTLHHDGFYLSNKSSRPLIYTVHDKANKMVIWRRFLAGRQHDSITFKAPTEAGSEIGIYLDFR